MDKNLILLVQNENWSLKKAGDWSMVTWAIFNDGTYEVETILCPETDRTNYIHRKGKIRAESFQKLLEAISYDWDLDLQNIDACDGEAWKIEQYDNETMIRSSGPLGYVYGKEAIERIIDLLPCKDSVYEKKYKQVFDRLADDGCRLQRSTRRENNLIRCSVRYNFTLVPFAMDMAKEEFMIFMLPRKEELSVFLWVYFNEEDEKKRIRITAVNDLMLYTKWTCEAMDVSGHYADKKVKKAISILSEYPQEQLWSKFEEMKEKMNNIGGVEAWKESEYGILETAEEAKAFYNGRMFMY